MFGIAYPLFFCLLFITLQSLMSEMIGTMFDEHIQRNTKAMEVQQEILQYAAKMIQDLTSNTTAAGVGLQVSCWNYKPHANSQAR